MSAPNDPLEAALKAAASELATEHGWSFDEGFGTEPQPDSEFFVVVRKHLEPLLDQSAYVIARRAALKAELEALDAWQEGR